MMEVLTQAQESPELFICLATKKGQFCASKAFLWDVRWVNHRAVPFWFFWECNQ